MQDKFLEAYSFYRNEVWFVAYSKCLNFETANDLTQEAFLRYWREIKKGSIVAFERSWLCKVVRNLAEDYRKSAFCRNGTMSSESLEKIDSGIILPIIAIEKAELTTALNLILLELNQKDRRILELRYSEDKKIDEIAIELELKSDLVKMRLFRARKKVRNLLQKIGFGVR